MDVVMDGISSSCHGKGKRLFERTPVWMTVRGKNASHSWYPSQERRCGPHAYPLCHICHSVHTPFWWALGALSVLNTQPGTLGEGQASNGYCLVLGKTLALGLWRMF